MTTCVTEPPFAAKMPPIRRIGRDDLRHLFSEWDTVARVLPILGISPDVRPDQSFPCVLPHHAEHGARLVRNRRGVFVYRDERSSLGTAVYTLADVFRIQCTNMPSKMRGPTLAVWTLRLLAQAGTLEPVHVDLLPLPESASADAGKVHKGLAQLLALRWTYETGVQPVPFSHRFAASWCGVSENSAGRAIKELLRWKVIRPVGHCKGRFDKHMALFMPGPGPPGQHRAKAAQNHA